MSNEPTYEGQDEDDFDPFANEVIFFIKDEESEIILKDLYCLLFNINELEDKEFKDRMFESIDKLHTSLGGIRLAYLATKENEIDLQSTTAGSSNSEKCD